MTFLTPQKNSQNSWHSSEKKNLQDSEYSKNELGDAIGDAEMSKGIPHETILKIGFLNDSTNLEKSLDQYSDVFDIVSVRDDTFKVQTKNSNSLNNYK